MSGSAAVPVAPVESGAPLDATAASAPASRPRPRNPGVAIVAMALGGFAIGTTEFASMGLLPNISRSLAVSEVETGHLISAYALGVVVGAPVLAALGARVERRLLLVVLMAVLVGGHLFSAFAPGYRSLMLARFVSALPHGAYFGIAAVVAASLVAPNRRGTAVAGIMLGLTVANVIGVPLTTAIGQAWGWRAAYLLVAVLGVVTLVLVLAFVPRVPVPPGATMRGELQVLRNGRMWFTLAIGAIGFGGMFAVYTFIAPIMTHLAGLAETTVPWILGMFGLGGTAGMLVGGRLADRSPGRAIIIGFVLTILTFGAFTLTAGSPSWSFVNVFALGFSGSSLIPSVQTRLMAIAPDAPSLAASLSHSAFNVANAVGAWLGGVVIAAGWGYLGPSRVAVALSGTGLVLFAGSMLVDRYRGRSVRPGQAIG